MALIAGAVVLALVIPAAILIINEQRRQSELDELAAQPIEGVEEFTITSQVHVAGDVDYEQTPPVGGDHDAVWQNCGFYDEPVRSEHAVHSLEHGAVWVTYDPELDAAEVDTLRRLANRHPFLLASPYEGLPSPVVASAWGYQLQLDTTDDARLDAFLRQYLQGPQTPEPGAACHGGVG